MELKHVKHFGFVYGCLSFILGVALFTLVTTLKTESNAATKTQVQQVKSSLGSSNVVQIAEKEVQTQAGAAGLLVSKQRVVSEKQDSGSATVVLAVTLVDTATGATQHLKLRVQLSKSL